MANIHQDINRRFAILEYIGALIEHFLEGSALVKLWYGHIQHYCTDGRKKVHISVPIWLSVPPVYGNFPFVNFEQKGNIEQYII